MLSANTLITTDARIMPAPKPFRLRRFHRVEDVPMEPARALLVDHGKAMHARMVGSGGPDFDIYEHIDAFWAGFDAYLPPKGSYYLAHNAQNEVVGTGALKRISDTTAEMKHLYVHPEMRRSGLGQALVEARIADARQMGIKELVADTFAANHEQPALYDKIGFQRVAPSKMSATGQISPELEPFMLFFRMEL